jgi:hypothetical protein
MEALRDIDTIGKLLTKIVLTNENKANLAVKYVKKKRDIRHTQFA